MEVKVKVNRIKCNAGRVEGGDKGKDKCKRKDGDKRKDGGKCKNGGKGKDGGNDQSKCKDKCTMDKQLDCRIETLHMWTHRIICGILWKPTVGYRFICRFCGNQQ